MAVSYFLASANSLFTFHYFSTFRIVYISIPFESASLSKLNQKIFVAFKILSILMDSKYSGKSRIQMDRNRDRKKMFFNNIFSNSTTYIFLDHTQCQFIRNTVNFQLVPFLIFYHILTPLCFLALEFFIVTVS